ncbi:MAG: hypothetical protein QM681_24145 [Novosphingobium sp.]
MVAVSVSERVLALPRPAKRAIVLAADALLCAVSVHLAYYLRTNDWPHVFGPALYPTITSILLALPFFIVFGLYRAIFRYAGNAAILAIVKAVTVYALSFAVIYTWVGIPGVPRTI